MATNANMKEWRAKGYDVLSFCHSMRRSSGTAFAQEQCHFWLLSRRSAGESSICYLQSCPSFRWPRQCSQTTLEESSRGEPIIQTKCVYIVHDWWGDLLLLTYTFLGVKRWWPSDSLTCLQSQQHHCVPEGVGTVNIRCSQVHLEGVGLLPLVVTLSVPTCPNMCDLIMWFYHCCYLIIICLLSLFQF